VTGEKKTEGIRFDWAEADHQALQRIARAKGYESHNQLARQWVLERLEAEIHAAKVVLGIQDVAGISRNLPEPTGMRRK